MRFQRGEPFLTHRRYFDQGVIAEVYEQDRAR